MVLNGAMCGISDKFKPPWPLEHFLSLAAFLVPTWCVVPTRGSLPDVSFKVVFLFTSTTLCVVSFEADCVY